MVQRKAPVMRFTERAMTNAPSYAPSGAEKSGL
jgi:hypothetical protein